MAGAAWVRPDLRGVDRPESDAPFGAQSLGRKSSRKRAWDCRLRNSGV
jgi:hypothetical protein